jgi:hypothetical protein
MDRVGLLGAIDYERADLLKHPLLSPTKSPFFNISPISLISALALPAVATWIGRVMIHVDQPTGMDFIRRIHQMHQTRSTDLKIEHDVEPTSPAWRLLSNRNISMQTFIILSLKEHTAKYHILK